MQQVRMGSPVLAHPPQMPGKQPPRMLFQQIQAARLNNSVKPGQSQSPVHGPQQRQQPSVSPQQHAKPPQQQLSNILQSPSQVSAPPPPPPYPGPPPPYPGNNSSQQGTEQVCNVYYCYPNSDFRFEIELCKIIFVKC